MLHSLDEIDRFRERLTDLIEKRRLLESQGKVGRDLHSGVLDAIERNERVVDEALAERRRFPLADLSDRIARWVVRTFGTENLTHRGERAMRIVEEAIELAQAEGVASTLVEKIARRVYSRPVGTIQNEAAGLLLTIAAWQATTPNVNVVEEARKLLDVLEAGDPFLFRGKHLAKVEAEIAIPGIPPSIPPGGKQV